jgi:hypothetical protein
MELVIAFIGFIGALLGAWLGGWLAGKYSRQATKDLLDGERKKREAEQKEQVQALLCALFGEIKSVWSNYMETSGNMVEAIPDNQPVRIYVPIIADYFPIYHGSVQMLGLIEDEHLLAQIISGYNVAKGLVDTLRLNNDFNSQRDHAHDQVFLNNTNQTQTVLKIKEQTLAAYGPKVKEAHARAKKIAENLIPLLESAVKK